MAKKIEDAEVKKECPSCGLGVALDATICEFCGWDFQEEDEWILQIEKLERDLMLEKQKFEPGTVDQRIESTLHTPALERIEMIKSSQKPGQESPGTRPQAKAPSPSAPATRGIREAAPSEIAREVVNPVPQARQSPAQQPAANPASAGTHVRRVRTVKAPAAAEEPSTVQAAPDGPGTVRRSRVRKVKQ